MEEIGRLHATGDPCPSCHGTGFLTAPVEERYGGYIDGPRPAARLWLVHVAGASGLDPVEERSQYLFSERFKIREREALRDMEDGELTEHVGRLRRVLVMAEEDGLDAWFVDLQRSRHAYAADELRWRQRAADHGGDRLAGQAAWRERVERIKASVDLALLIALENDKAKSTGRGQWECCCPFHADKSPSLSVDAVKGLWCCHGCHVGGDAFTYVELRYGMDFAAAVRHLEQRL